MSDPWLSVVVPAYNEAARIQPTLDRIFNHLRRRGRPFEVLVVDDGSTDGTAERVDERAEPELRVIRSPRNEGKGAAVRRGVIASRGGLVLLTDADLSTPIEALERLEALLSEGAALVCGSRGLAASNIVEHQPFYRERMGKTFNRLVRLLGLTSFRDTQCGFKLFRGEAARDIFSRSRLNGFAFDVEVLYLARRLGYRALEVPVDWRHVPESRVHPLKDSARMLRDVIRLRFFG